MNAERILFGLVWAYCIFKAVENLEKPKYITMVFWIICMGIYGAFSWG